MASKATRKTNAALEALRSFRHGSLVSLLAPFPIDADDRAVALIIYTNLEHALEDAIASYFMGDVDALRKRLFSGGGQSEGVISTFFAKSWLAHALGIFGPETMKDLNTIRLIRNIFAHSAVSISFQTPAIVEACTFSSPSRLPPESDIRKSDPLSARDLFIKVGTLLGGTISSLTYDYGPPDEFHSEETIEKIRSSARVLLA